MFNLPPRDDRPGHGKKLLEHFSNARTESQNQDKITGRTTSREGITVEVRSEHGFPLTFERLDRQGDGIELLNVREQAGVTYATVFIPSGKEETLVKLLEDYIGKDTKSGKPQNQPLVESISEIRLAAMESFWTDAEKTLPGARDKLWWEIWLNDHWEGSGIIESFREVCSLVGLRLSKRIVKFPERIVLLGYGTLEQLTSIYGLFDYLAELRKAKEVPTDFLSLTPVEQVDFINDALNRIQAPPANAPAVCLLDTGVRRSHPLLELAISEDDVLSCDPTWPTDDRNGHGTEMAGLSLYGCLSTVLSGDKNVILTHRLESIKILPDQGENSPDHWGAITQEAVARAELQAPTRRRTLCMTVTGDNRDEGYPTSWSAAVDQLCSGQLDGKQRLMFISAGNIKPRELRNEYPNRNHVEGIQNPAQAWNAVTTGAFTDRVALTSQEFSDWQPLGEKGKLSPCSTTSLAWGDHDWPLKPDIVMEGGNDIIHPQTRQVDTCDDLSLLTTKMVYPGGSFLVSTGETSAAAAQAARLAAIIQAEYPSLWSETVRALIIHSAEWTAEMLEEFDFGERRNRLRCYGYGVPNIKRALKSASNSVTLVSQEHIRPYTRENGPIQTDEIHFHELPWPREALQQLGENDVSMKVTLSYFIEPSPGRRGWENKFRYASHGLRFDVLRPLETIEQFKQRLTRSAWNDENERPDSSSSTSQKWDLGPKLRARGSVHSDRWCGSGSELANTGYVAIYPVTGWWKERPHLRGWAKSTRYALIVSIETPNTDVDLYTPITQEIRTRIDAAQVVTIPV